MNKSFVILSLGVLMPGLLIMAIVLAGPHTKVSSEQSHKMTPAEVDKLKQFFKSDPHIYACVNEDGSGSAVASGRQVGNRPQTLPDSLPCKEPL